MSLRAAQTQWHIQGEEVSSCNCDWGCPCQFNAPPTHGGCHGIAGFRIRKGHFGATSLDGVRFAHILVWPGRIDLGGGTMQLILDRESSAEQREALIVLSSGREGGGYFEIFAATCSTALDPIVAPIIFETDRERRTGKVIVPHRGRDGRQRAALCGLERTAPFRVRAHLRSAQRLRLEQRPRVGLSCRP